MLEAVFIPTAYKLGLPIALGLLVLPEMWLPCLPPQVGRKRAPNFTGDLRRLVYRCYLSFEEAKAQMWGWDRADLVAHLYHQLLGGKYQGARLDGVYRDEVQDFTQVGGGGVDGSECPSGGSVEHLCTSLMVSDGRTWCDI